MEKRIEEQECEDWLLNNWLDEQEEIRAYIRYNKWLKHP